MGDLYNQTVSPGGTTRNDYGGTIGNRFAPKSTVYLNAVSFWCEVNSGTKPGFNVWNNSSNLRLQKLASTITWVGTAPGWFTCTLSESESNAIGPITGNTTWEVDLIVASGGVTWRQGCNTPDNTVEFSYEGARYGGSSSVIADNTAGAPWGISVTVSDSPAGGSGGGGSGGATSADLAAWLSSDSTVNTHQSDGAPWQTLQDAATLLSRLGNVTSGNVTTYGLSDATLVAAVLKALNYLVTNGNNLNSLSDLVDRIWTWFGGTSSPPTTDALATILNRLDLATEGTENDTHQLLRRQLAWGTFPTGWTLQDTAAIDGNLAFTTAADAYALTITTPYPGEGALATAAGTYLPRLGWWCPLQGSYGRQRQFIDLGQLLLVDEGRRMPGCAVQLQPGTLATIEAWTID